MGYTHNWASFELINCEAQLSKFCVCKFSISILRSTKSYSQQKILDKMTTLVVYDLELIMMPQWLWYIIAFG